MAVIGERNKIQLFAGRTQIPCNLFLFPCCSDVFFLFLGKKNQNYQLRYDKEGEKESATGRLI